MAQTNDPNTPKRYNEYRVTIDRGKIVSKQPTARGQVSIHDNEAELKNAAMHTTKLYYEKAEPSIVSLEDIEKPSELNRLRADEAMELAQAYGHDPQNGKEAKKLLADEWNRMQQNQGENTE